MANQEHQDESHEYDSHVVFFFAPEKWEKNYHTLFGVLRRHFGF